MKEKDFIGLTIEESIKAIRKAEGNKTYMFYVCVRKHLTHNGFKIYKKYHLHNENGKRVYKVVEQDRITFAKDRALQNDSFVLECEIRKGEHSNWSLNGFVSNGYHNEYWLFIDGLAKGNKGNSIYENRTERLIEYKEGELSKKDRRFTL